MPLISKAKVSSAVADALNAISAKLDTETLVELNQKVIAEDLDPAAVAQAWLFSEGLA